LTRGLFGLSGVQLLIQKILRQDEQGDTHEGEGLSPLAISRELEGAGGLQMLGPTQSHAASVRRN
jgi:hypothetical protein